MESDGENCEVCKGSKPDGRLWNEIFGIFASPDASKLFKDFFLLAILKCFKPKDFSKNPSDKKENSIFGKQ